MILKIVQVTHATNMHLSDDILTPYLKKVSEKAAFTFGWITYLPLLNNVLNFSAEVKIEKIENDGVLLFVKEKDFTNISEKDLEVVERLARSFEG